MTNNQNKENNQSKKCSCGSVQFDYAGRCLPCKSKHPTPPVERIQSIGKALSRPKCGCTSIMDVVKGGKEYKVCELHSADQSNTIGSWEEELDSLLLDFDLLCSEEHFNRKDNDEYHLIKKVIKDLVTQATQEARQQGYDEAVKMCREKIDGEIDEDTWTEQDGIRYDTMLANRKLRNIINELTPDGK